MKSETAYILKARCCCKSTAKSVLVMRPTISPNHDIYRDMLATATGFDLDEIATILGHEPSIGIESDAAFRLRMGGIR